MSEEEARLIELQINMRSRINHDAHVGHYRFVGGADLTVEDDLYVGCFIVVDCENNLQPIYEKCTEMKVDVPYIPSLLCFREGPVVLALLGEFKKEHPEIVLDVILVDGCGEWHPRGLGFACYVGLECGIPTIGVSKSFLYVGSEHNGKKVQTDAQDVCKNIGDVMMLNHQINGIDQISCAVMKTTASTPFKPIFISAGHLININDSIEIVKSLCHFREPEPLRLADRISRAYVRNKKKAE